MNNRAQTVLRVALKKLHPEAFVPKYQTPGAAAFDIHACLPEGDGKITIPAGGTYKVPTKIAAWIGDPNWALCIWERSGLGSKGIGRRGGLVDSDYQGELFIVLANGTDTPFDVAHGDRIAQGCLTNVIQAQFVEVEDFSEKSERGDKGFGSSGISARSPQDIMLEAARGGPPDVSELIDDSEGLMVEDEGAAS